MIPIARRTTTVSERRQRVNPNYFRFRYDARRRALDDRRLPRCAVVVYLRIDDADGECEGRAYIQQATLAVMLGYSEVWIRHCLRVLEKAGYLRTIREQHGVRYVLGWVAKVPTESPASGDIKSVGRDFKRRERRSALTLSDLSCSTPRAVILGGGPSPEEVEALLRERGCSAG